MNPSSLLKKTRLLPAALSGLLLTVIPAAAELPQYTVTRLDTWLGPLPGSGPYPYPLALNNSGEVLVSSTATTTTYQTWRDGVRTDPGPAVFPDGYMNGGTTHFRAFTDAGVQAVDAYNATLDKTGLVAVDVRHGTSTLLPDIPGAVMDGSSLPVLSSGGDFMVARSDDYTRGWLLDLGTLKWTEMSGPGWYVQPDAVNNSGAAAGRMADAAGNTVPFVWTAGAGIQTITDHGTAIQGHATAINGRGLITGTADGKSFVFNSANGELTWITPGSDQNAADINNAGQIIGTFWNPPILGVVPGNLGWVATVEDGFMPLTNLLGQDTANPEWRINETVDINDDGWILATAYNYKDQRSYQVLLRPVPEPGVAALLVTLGSFGFLTRRRRRADVKT